MAHKTGFTANGIGNLLLQAASRPSMFAATTI